MYYIVFLLRLSFIPPEKHEMQVLGTWRGPGGSPPPELLRYKPLLYLLVVGASDVWTFSKGFCWFGSGEEQEGVRGRVLKAKGCKRCIGKLERREK